MYVHAKSNAEKRKCSWYRCRYEKITPFVLGKGELIEMYFRIYPVKPSLIFEVQVARFKCPNSWQMVRVSRVPGGHSRHDEHQHRVR